MNGIRAYKEMNNEKERGDGVVYQDVTRNSNISAAAKGIYAYLSAFCGGSDECYPSVETIIKEMGIGRDTFYRHINALVAVGGVEKRKTVNDGGKFGRTVYCLTHKVAISDYPITQNEDAVLSTTEDFKRLFELAEGSNFLKGGNSRNWSATFDWLIADGKMAKVFDGNYSDKRKEKGDKVNETQSGSSFILWCVPGVWRKWMGTL